MALAMASHPRLGAYSEPSVRQVAASRDLLLAIFRHVTLTVPDDAPTLHCALRKALPWQRILLRCGEYLVSSLDNDHPGSSVLRLRSPVHIVGEPGTIIRGTLIFEASCAGGSLSDLRIDSFSTVTVSYSYPQVGTTGTRRNGYSTNPWNIWIGV